MEIKITLPCEGCEETACRQEACRMWQDHFLESWAALNRFAWKQMDQQGRRRFTYELPHLEESPCTDCPCRAWCDTPCSQRLRWWDHRMAAVRGRMQHGINSQTAALR